MINKNPLESPFKGKRDTNNTTRVYWKDNEFRVDDGVILRGLRNTLHTKRSMVIDGDYNNLHKDNCKVIIGDYNELEETKTVVMVGNKNILTEQESNVCIGNKNIIKGTKSTIIDGDNNNINSPESVILSGDNNKIDGTKSAIIYGDNNTTSEHSVIINGHDNIITGNRASVVTGLTNTIEGNNSIVVNGNDNSITSIESAVITGNNNNITKDNCVIAGNHNIITHKNNVTDLAFNTESIIEGCRINNYIKSDVNSANYEWMLRKLIPANTFTYLTTDGSDAGVKAIDNKLLDTYYVKYQIVARALDTRVGYFNVWALISDGIVIASDIDPLFTSGMGELKFIVHEDLSIEVKLLASSNVSCIVNAHRVAS